MRPVLIIENDAADPAGYLGEALAAAAVPTHLIRAYQGDVIPPAVEWTAIVVLGGSAGAYETDKYPWLEPEMQLIRDGVAADVPVLGICLGAQLIAHALGGNAHLAAHPEVGVIESVLTDEGRADPLSAHLPGPYVVFHQDTFELPPGATLLATSDAYPQAFRCGSALALQPHPEVSAEVVNSWFDRSALPGRAGVLRERFMAQHDEEVSPDRSRALFTAWIEDLGPDRGGH